MNLITDRTVEDVLARSAKGNYGCDDLNRVESAVEKLQTQLQELDIFPCLKVKTDWQFTSSFHPDTWPTKPQMERYLQNVRTLAAAVGVTGHLPESMEHLDYAGANGVELTLMDVARRIQSIVNTYEFSGELIAGEENGI